MKIKSQISKIGNGYFIAVPKLVLTTLSLAEKEIIDIEINKISELLNYKCRVCEYEFCSEDDIPYCPYCGEEGHSILRKKEVSD